MASPAQITANQLNARHSTGPKSAEGKAASAKNATRHGLSSAFLVLAHEDQAGFDELLASRAAEHEPATFHQRFLVEQIVKSEWILARAQRLEARALDFLGSLAEPDLSDPDTLIVARMFEANLNAWVTLQRYAVQAERSYYKALRELTAAKKIQNEADSLARPGEQPPAPVVDRATVEAPPPGPPAQPKQTQYGFVPQLGRHVTAIGAATAPGKLLY